MIKPINDYVQSWNDFLNDRRFKTVGNINFYNSAIVFDGDTQSVWMGGNIDSDYIGKSID